VTTDIRELLLATLAGQETNRPRSLQRAVGPSSIGDCKRKVFHILTETPRTNISTEKLASMMGTFIHDGIARAFNRDDPFRLNTLIEERISGLGITGNVDLFLIPEGIVIDWKTVTKSGLSKFPTSRQRWQVMVYGAILIDMGYTVNEVALVAIARDGSSDNIKIHQEPYDPKMAQDALDWLSELQDLVFNQGVIPEPDPTKNQWFCSNYCEFYDKSGQVGCPSNA
jgi:PD-(D/E)XK nuclease superfamily